MKTSNTRAVFLDRDGVINCSVVDDGKPYPPSRLDELEIIDGVPEALHQLKQAGFSLICVTNQPDVARGKQSRGNVEAIHRFLMDTLPLDEVIVCYHDDADACGCRKPLPGMLVDAAGRYGIDLNQSYMVGDRWRDIDAGAAAGCETILIDYHYEERVPSNKPDARVGTLSEAAEWILQRTN